jgi:hypothetical protein
VWDDKESWPAQGNLFLGGFHYDRFSEKAPADAESRKTWLRLQPRNEFLPQP